LKPPKRLTFECVSRPVALRRIGWRARIQHVQALGVSSCGQIRPLPSLIRGLLRSFWRTFRLRAQLKSGRCNTGVVRFDSIPSAQPHRGVPRWFLLARLSKPQGVSGCSTALSICGHGSLSVRMVAQCRGRLRGTRVAMELLVLCTGRSALVPPYFDSKTTLA